ncbi:hypothetical protein FC70_GL001467 [Paucilactobacillus oligofermentans DSM 15707 = LMG 22743]|uniref:SpaA-like prealbumin fold domain-containing protein n=2 Tax=Paucilactobacillus oligofermentans TaxID=293371 RepID=A0A0R1RC20_9LACO|nr:hypothetical protein FC70_GL001467 [Paucilactobacillus oligofermentans DSM 15707 = LMG 22743]
MTILILAGVSASSGVIVADAIAYGAPEEYVSSEVILKDSDDDSVTYGGDKTIYEHLETKADNPAISGAYSVIKLARDRFKAPVVSDVTNGDNYILKADVDNTSDPDNYLVKLYYNDIPATGTDVKVPFVVHTLGMPNDSSFPISDKTYDSQGNILSNGKSLTLKYALANPDLYIMDTTKTVPEDIVSETDNTITKEVPEVLVNTWGSGNTGTSTVDMRTFKISIQLPNDYKLDDSYDYSNQPSSDIWQYDAKTNIVSYTNSPNADGTHTWDRIMLPLTAKVGAKVDEFEKLQGKITVVGNDTDVIASESGTVKLEKKEVIDVPGEAYKTFNAYDGNIIGNDTITANTKSLQLLGNLYATGNFRNGGSDTSKLNEYVDTIVDEPQSDIDYSKLASDDEAKATKDEGDYSVYNQIWLKGNFSEETRKEAAKNTVTIDYTDGTDFVIDDLNASSGSEYFNKEGKTVKKVTIKFDNPIHVTDTDGYNMMVGLQGSMTKSAVQNIVNSDYQNAKVKNNMTVFYANNTNHKSSIDKASYSLTKKIPSVTNADGDWASVDTDDMLPGGTVNATAEYNVRNIDALQTKDQVLKNGKMFFLVDTGVKLGDISKIKGLTNVKTEYNYKNTGKTAIYGDITNGDLSSSDETITKLSYTIPLTNTNALDKGGHSFEAYLIFDNNGLDSYNLTKLNGKGSFETADLSNYYSNTNWKIDNHNLYDNTEKPTAFLGETNNFQFIPSAALTATNLVEQGSTSDNWVEDTGKLASQAGDEFTYLLKTSNYSMNQDFNDLDAIDVLPTVGDKFITDSSKDRGSEFSVGLKQAVQDVPAGYHVMYSTDKPKDKYEDNQVANWVNSNSVTDFSKVTMVRLQADQGTTLLHDKSVSVKLNVNTPDNIDYKTDLETDNTFAVYGKTADLKSALVESNKSVIRTVGGDPVIENGSMQISKIDAADATKHLAGAAFKLTSADGTIKTGVTNQAGELDVADLTAGTYKVVETKAPTGYQLDPTEQTVNVTANQTAKAMFLDKREVVTPTTGNLKLIKVAEQDKTNKLAGAHFNIVDTNGKTQQAITNNDGEINLDNLIAGNYEVTETQAPIGYVLDTTTKQVTVTKNQTATLTISNKLKDTPIVPEVPDTGNLKLIKVAHQDKNKKLSGAHFNIVSEDGTSQQAITDSNGEIKVNDIATGNYKVTETQAPTGYMLDNKVTEVTVTKDQIATVTISNKLKDTSVDPGTPVDPEKPIVPEKVIPTKPVVKPTVTLPKNDKTKLPQTGEQIVAGSVVFLVVLLTAGFGTLCLYQYRTKKR